MRNTVLIVEDDAILQLFFSEQLETLGWKTRLAPSTASAMAELGEHSDDIAVVVTDVEMPGTRNGIYTGKPSSFWMARDWGCSCFWNGTTKAGRLAARCSVLQQAAER